MSYIILGIIALIVITGYFLFTNKAMNRKYILEVKRMLKSIKNEEYVDISIQEVKEEYEDVVNVLIDKEKAMKRNLNELDSYKQELNMTYKSLLAKSTELEYMNNLLEKKFLFLFEYLVFFNA